MYKYQIKPCLIVFSGLPLTGKTTIANKIAAISNFKVCDLDEARTELFGEVKEQPKEKEWEILQKSYQKNHEFARLYLSQRHPVIITGTYSLEFSHQQLKDLIKMIKVPFKIFYFYNDENVYERLKKRNENNELSAIRTQDSFNDVKQKYKLIEGLPVEKIDTSGEVDNIIEKIFESLKKLNVL